MMDAPLRAIAAASCLLLLTACPARQLPVPTYKPPVAGNRLPSGLDSGFLVCAQGVENGRPYARLCNGQVMQLIAEPQVGQPTVPQPPVVQPPVRQPPIAYPVPVPRATTLSGNGSGPNLRPALLEGASEGAPQPMFRRVQLPARVSLEGQQTPFRLQTGDSCTWFAVTAGLEAAYRRLEGVTLDLSEAHFQHLTKLSLVYAGRPLPKQENQLGAWGGGNIETNLAMMVQTGAGVPLQALHPNPPSSNFQNANAGDLPDLMDWSKQGDTPQRTFDDWNLRHAPMDMMIPEPLRWTPLPPAALAGGRYRATAVRWPSASEVRSVDWYRQQLNDGNEIIVQFACCTIWFQQGSDPDSSRADQGRPHPTLGAGPQVHAALLVGYDDRLGVFLMKNSWGEGQVRQYHYDNVTSGAVYGAAVIEAVVPANWAFGVDRNPAAWIGDWHLLDMGQPGMTNGSSAGRLSIYRVPTAAAGRLGTFHAQDGGAFRVNGVLDGRKLSFWIDPARPDAPFTPAVATGAGHRYEAMLFDDDRDQMVGKARVEGRTDVAALRGFTARRLGPLSLTPVVRTREVPRDIRALFGHWEMQLEGRRARWFFSRFNADASQVTGWVSVNGGPQRPATGAVNGNVVVLTSDDPALRLLITRFVTGDRTVMGGWLNAPNVANGHVAVLLHESAIVIPQIPEILGSTAK